MVGKYGSMRGLTGSVLRQLGSDPWFRTWVALAALGTLVFYALHVAHVIAGTRFDAGGVLFDAGFKAWDFSIEAEQGYAEWFEYLMLAFIVINVARLAFTCRRPVYVAFLFIFVYALADNALAIHERLGAFLVDRLALPPAFGLRGQDLGELATWALFGVPLLGFLCFALWRTEGRHRSVGLTLTGWFFVFAFFGGAVDMMHSLIRHQGAWERIAGFVEDGGEMAVIAVILTLTLAVPAYLREERAADDGNRPLRLMPLRARRRPDGPGGVMPTGG